MKDRLNTMRAILALRQKVAMLNDEKEWKKFLFRMISTTDLGWATDIELERVQDALAKMTEIGE